MFKVYDFRCVPCDAVLEDRIVADEDVVICPRCNGNTERMFPCAKSGDGTGEKFTPFWSDTFQMNVNDRNDLNKLKEMRKKAGLTCVGHNKMKPDRKAIRWNYEHE